MKARSALRLIMAAAWLAGGILLWIGFRTQAGVLWQSTPAAIICLLMVTYNLFLAWFYSKRKKRAPDSDDSL